MQQNYITYTLAENKFMTLRLFVSQSKLRKIYFHVLLEVLRGNTTLAENTFMTSRLFVSQSKLGKVYQVFFVCVSVNLCLKINMKKRFKGASRMFYFEGSAGDVSSETEHFRSF